MPYRRTESVVRRLAEREQTIVEAARSAARAGGMSAVQIAAVAERAGIASGTVSDDPVPSFAACRLQGMGG